MYTPCRLCGGTYIAGLHSLCLLSQCILSKANRQKLGLLRRISEISFQGSIGGDPIDDGSAAPLCCRAARELLERGPHLCPVARLPHREG